MTHKPTTTREFLDGEQRLFHFANGYTASVICNERSYGYEDGLFELAVLRDDKVVYDTPITDDVVGWLTEDEVQALLTRIEAL